MYSTIRDNLLTTMSLLDRCPRAQLVKVTSSHPDCECLPLVEFALDNLIEEGAIGLELGVTKDQDVVYYINRQVLTPEEIRVLDNAAFWYHARMFCRLAFGTNYWRLWLMIFFLLSTVAGCVAWAES